MSMGVYINMEMPKSCDDCRLNNGISCYAVPEYTEDGVVGRTDDRPDWCPLVPVPPHGRLIDADALIDSFDPSDFWNPDAEDNCFAAIHVVNCAPTIIPAEEE